MGTATITLQRYTGTLTQISLEGILNQITLNHIGPEVSATIQTDDQTLASGDPATITFQGSDASIPLSYIGSGTISTVRVIGLPVLSAPISIFQADGSFYFYLPNDLPFLSRLTANIQVYADSPLTLDGFVPCFASGTRIMTRRGNVVVEDIRPGEIVMDTSGRQHKVLWVGSNTIDLTTLPDDHYLKLVPVRIKADLIDTRAPFADLVVSQQHRIQIRHPMTETLFGVIDCFVPAL